MSNLVDSTTGLDFGASLQFQTQIGTAGLIITAVSIAAPALSLASAPGTDPPELTATFDATVLEGDILVLQYAQNAFFTSASTATHTLDAADILAGEYTFTTPPLGGGMWFFRARDTRGSLGSPWSNTVSDDIAGGIANALDYSVAGNSQYLMMGWL